jgi:hypothetical protein
MWGWYNLKYTYFEWLFPLISFCIEIPITAVWCIKLWKFSNIMCDLSSSLSPLFYSSWISRENITSIRWSITYALRNSRYRLVSYLPVSMAWWSVGDFQFFCQIYLWPILIGNSSHLFCWIVVWDFYHQKSRQEICINVPLTKDISMSIC